MDLDLDLHYPYYHSAWSNSNSISISGAATKKTTANNNDDTRRHQRIDHAPDDTVPSTHDVGKAHRDIQRLTTQLKKMRQ